jgi:hypothetical protein
MPRFPGNGHLSPEQEELQRMEREIVKQAALFFANEAS